MTTARIFKTAILQTDVAGLPQLREGICAEDCCYIVKILNKDETNARAIICKPQRGDIIAARVVDTGRYLTEPELGPISVLVPHKVQRSPIRVDEVRKVEILHVKFDYPEPVIYAYGKFV